MANITQRTRELSLKINITPETAFFQRLRLLYLFVVGYHKSSHLLKVFVISPFIPSSSVCIMAPRRKRLEGDSRRCTKQQSKKVHAKKRKYYFHKKKVSTVVADESESPSVVPGVEEEVAGESSSVLAPSVVPDETSGIVADVANSVPADVDVDFLMEDVICDDIAGSSSSVVDDVMNKTASSSKMEEIVCDQVQDKPISGYRLFDMDILKKLDLFPCLSRMCTDYVRFVNIVTIPEIHILRKHFFHHFRKVNLQKV